MNNAAVNHAPQATSGLFRLVSVAFRRYSVDPSTRNASARMLLISAIALYAEQTSAGEAALAASEGIATLATEERKRGAR